MASWRERLGRKQEAPEEPAERSQEPEPKSSAALVSTDLSKLRTFDTAEGSAADRLRALAGEMSETVLSLGGGEVPPALRAMMPALQKMGEARLSRLTDAEATAAGLALMVLGARVLGDPALALAVSAYAERVALAAGVPLISAPEGVAVNAGFGEVFPWEESPEEG